jgi:mannose-1-phosphate guanylyltransferase
MNALLLAAGFGTRLRPITLSVPKCMVLIKGKPLLEYWLDLLLGNGVGKVLINTHYLPDVVNDFVRNSRWKDLISIVHEEELLGTAGTILKNRSFSNEKPLMVVHADNLTRFNPSEFISAHTRRKNGTCITMMTFDSDSPQSCGIVEINSFGVVEAFHEKVANPPGTRANAAVYILEPEVFDFIDSLGKEFCDISTEVLPNFLGRIQTFHNDDYHRDIGTPQSLALAQLEF